MKKLLEKTFTVVGGVACLVVFLSALWYCSGCSRERTYTSKIADSDLTVLNSETTNYGAEEVTVIDFFYLMRGDDTLTFRCCMYDPYVNAKGIIFVPTKGVYDCRDGKFARILKIETDPGSVPQVDVAAVDGKEEGAIEVGYPSKRYVYNLEINKIVAE